MSTEEDHHSKSIEIFFGTLILAPDGERQAELDYRAPGLQGLHSEILSQNHSHQNPNRRIREKSES